MKHHRILSQFIRYLRPYWFHEAVVLLLLILGTAASLAPPYMTKIIIDEAFPFKDHSLLMLTLATLLVVTVFGIANYFVVDYLYNWVSNRIMQDIRSELFAHLLRAPLSFYQRYKTGDILYRINNEVNTVQSIVSSSALKLLNSVFTLVGLSVMLCWLNTSLFLISIITIPLFLCKKLF